MIKMPRFLLLAVAAIGLASCKSPQTNADPYATTAGGYNPYPDQSGYATNSAPSYQQPTAPSYSTPPSPAPEPDPYAYTAPKTTASSSKPKSTTPAKKSTASSSTKKKASSSGKRYAVKQGDTLYGIARKNGTTVAKLKSSNGLNSDLIRPGQSLKIP